MRRAVVVLVALACLAVATAITPPAAADDESSGSCVWTSQQGTSVSAGYSLRDCKGSGGSSWEADP